MTRRSLDERLRDLVRLLRSGSGKTLTIPGLGRLHVERPVPYLCVYRTPPSHPDEGTAALVRSEASYLLVQGNADAERVRTAVTTVLDTLCGMFGASVVVEVWRGRVLHSDDDPEPTSVGKPRFRLLLPESQDLGDLPALAESALRQVRLGHERAEILVRRRSARRPGWAEPLFDDSALPPRVFSIGIAVEPVYQRDGGLATFPRVLRDLHRDFARALRRFFHQFSCSWTPQCATSYHVLGQRALVKTVWDVDARLAAIADSFDYLLQVTPVNSDQAWRDFQQSDFQATPTFLYRPLPIDPIVLKRNLFKIPVERVEDPALARLFREKVDEIDRQITLLEDIDTQRFVHGSMQLFGRPDVAILDTARKLSASSTTRENRKEAEWASAEEFVARAREEVEFYRTQHPILDAQVLLRHDIDRGLMVSHGTLLVGHQSTFPKNRVEALIHHEIGTHVLTYHNGKAQSFQQLHSGLAGYEALQEGLAVFSEYLCGGLDSSRLRILAARVIGVDAMLSGASFVEVFRLLERDQGFQPRVAFTITFRIFRGGGLTKDAVYLSGLRDLLRYLEKGGDIEPLFVGKIGSSDIPIVRELRLRQVLGPPPLQPRFLQPEEARKKLAAVGRGVPIEGLATD